MKSAEKQNLKCKGQKVLGLLFTFCILHFALTTPVQAKKIKIYTPEQKYKYEQKILRKEEIEKYKRSLLPESGYMTTKEYEEKSKDIPNSAKIVPEYQFPKDLKMKYVPQPTYKLVHYNNPPGAPELHLERRFKFDRQQRCGAITSPNKDILVYPVVYYYAVNQCSAGDLFLIPLDKSIVDPIKRIQRANIIKRNPEPILSTEKDIREKFIFRTMTPIDFSPDGSKLVAKEKIGNINDGIWQTNLWVYDFNTNKARQIPEIREAIKFYWKNQTTQSSDGLILDEKRWDIYPLGFDASDFNRVVVSAYGYTGKAPKFLGNWSIDCNGEQTRLVSLFNPDTKITVSGLKIIQDGLVEPKDVYKNEKIQDKQIKKDKKTAKKTLKKEAKQKKQALKKKLRDMKREESQELSQYRRQKMSPSQAVGD